jgi:5-methylcytosine-specific restriction endonuclease McrA
MKQQIQELLLQGKTYSEIVKQVGCAKSSIAYHAKKLGLQKSTYKVITYDWNEVQRIYEELKSPTQVVKHFGMSKGSFHKALKRGDLTRVECRIPLEDLLVSTRLKTGRGHLKQRLKEAGLLVDKCYICSRKNWRGKPLSLQLDHINGNTHDNTLDNLRLLCPNCHSQTDTWGGKNKKYKGVDKDYKV